MGRRQSSVSSNKAKTSSPSVTLQQEAEALQQRAERKRGRDAILAFEQAAAKFCDAITAGPAERVECLFGLGECLQMQADAVVACCQKLPDGELTPATEQAAAATAIGLYQRAVQAYQQVVEPPNGMRVDAAVNCGNTLSAMGELQQGQQPGSGLSSYTQAVQAYELALTQERDALTLSNLGDALMQLAEGAQEVGQADSAAAAASRALSEYESSCSLTDSASGDDLPGLLHNWGVGLRTAATLTQDRQRQLHLLEESVRRLQSSINFNRADPAPLNALGDALVAAAELLGSWQEAAAMYQRALQEGYQAALTLNRRDADALVGVAEVNAALGKLAAQAGQLQPAASHFQQSCAAYKAAVSDPTQLGSFKDRCNVRYNYACACALAAKEQEAAEQLLLLRSWQAVELADVAADEDLKDLFERPWFQQMISEVDVSMATGSDT